MNAQLVMIKPFVSFVQMFATWVTMLFMIHIHQEVISDVIVELNQMDSRTSMNCARHKNDPLEVILRLYQILESKAS